MPPDLLRLVDRVRQQPADGPGKALWIAWTISADAQVTERDREPDQRDQPLHEHERGDERERARVAEAVRGAQPARTRP